MSLKDDLNSEVNKVFKSQWSTRDGNVVPVDEALGLGNDTIKINATVLYADLADSTVLVDSYSAAFAAEIYKTFLHCAAKIIGIDDPCSANHDTLPLRPLVLQIRCYTPDKIYTESSMTAQPVP